MNHSAFAPLYELFPADQIPFLEHAKLQLSKAQPYRGLKVLHNVPLTMESLHKIHAIALGGAEVTVTSPSFMEPKDEAIALLRRAGIPTALSGELPRDVDISMDCAGELLDVVDPRIGAVELTGTGTQRYAAMADLAYPVVSVDQSSVKNLEALLGTGDGFLRAIQELTGERIAGWRIVLLGFGKVGQGIAHALLPFTSDIAVVEADPDRLQLAREERLTALCSTERPAVEALVSEADLVVTATGRKSVVSDHYDAAAFRQARYLANMGGEDEFGPAFTASEVLVEKKPINFAIDRPTKIRYLDPVFYAHNLGLDLLLLGDLSPGLHPFPAFLADEIVSAWQTWFQEGPGEWLHAGARMTASPHSPQGLASASDRWAIQN